MDPVSDEQAGPPTDEGQLAGWVQAVVRRWQARGLRGRELANLFARLLNELVVARTRGAATKHIVRLGPEAAADGIARTGRLRGLRTPSKAGPRRRTSPRSR